MRRGPVFIDTTIRARMVNEFSVLASCRAGTEVRVAGCYNSFLAVQLNLASTSKLNGASYIASFGARRGVLLDLARQADDFGGVLSRRLGRMAG